MYVRWKDRVTRFMEGTLATIQDLKDRDDELGTQIAAIVADVEKLLAAVSSIPPGSLSAADQQTLDDAVAAVTGQTATLKGEDAIVNPAPTPPPAP